MAHAWSFGDGSTGSGVAPSHSYGNNGTFTVTLTVTDNKGATGTDTAIMTIANRAPVANAGSNQSGAPGTSLTFNGTGSSDPDGTITNYTWTFGDGTTGSGATVTHAYATAGTYTVTLTVRDDDGAQTSDTATATVAATGSETWADSVGSTGADGGYAVAVDDAGNVIFGGTFRGSVDLGGGVSLVSSGGADWFIVKYTPTGTPVWAKAIGGLGDEYLESLAVNTAGDVVATGRFSGSASFGGLPLVALGTTDIAVAKYRASDGAHQWSKRFGGAYDDNGNAIAVDGTGAVYLTGYFRGTVDFGGGILRVPFDTDLDVFVTKLDANGNHVWSKNFSNDGNDRGYGIAVDDQGTLMVVGSFSNSINFGGGSLVSQNAMTDAFVAKFSSATGAHQWSRQMGATDGNETAYGVTIDASGNAVVCGAAVKSVDFGGGSLGALGGSDGFVVTYRGTTGAHLWSRRIGGTNNDYAYAVAATAGGVVVGGAFEGTASFGGAPVPTSGASDAYAAKYDSGGALVWARSVGGIDADVGQDLAMAPSGHPVLVGYFYGTSTFAGTSLTSAGMADAFIVKMAP